MCSKHITSRQVHQSPSPPVTGKLEKKSLSCAVTARENSVNALKIHFNDILYAIALINWLTVNLYFLQCNRNPKLKMWNIAWVSFFVFLFLVVLCLGGICNSWSRNRNLDIKTENQRLKISKPEMHGVLAWCALPPFLERTFRSVPVFVRHSCKS